MSEEKVKVTFDLGDLGGNFSLDVTEVRKWFDADSATWVWLDNVRDDANPQTAAALVATRLRVRGKRLYPAFQNLEADPNAVNADALAREIENQYKNQAIPHSSTAAAKFVN